MFTWNCKGRLWLVDKPQVMGIINITPDSFFSDSRSQDMDAILYQAEKMVKEGADILDIGGQSTRPGSVRIDADEELSRVIGPVKAIHQRFPGMLISIDTYHARVAREAVDAGASIVNDISAGSLDEEMLDTVAALQVPYVLMHMQGRPDTMQKEPHYADVTREVLDFLVQRSAILQQMGIKDIIVDPGFGFGKTTEHNFRLLQELDVFSILKRPVLLGISRKSAIYKILGTTANEALNGTTVLNTIGLLKGASILRVHDVKEAKEAITLVQAMQASK